MALPTCPSCGQSVLDDDVEECPFCNASMSAAATPKPDKPQPKAVQKQSVGKPSTSQKQKPRPKKEGTTPSKPSTVPADSPGIPLVKYRTKTNRFPVVCPMCDTKGFAPKSASGREVRCVNGSCLVPLFDAPRLKDKKKEDAPPPKSLMPMVSGSIVLLAIIGAAVWFFVFKKETPKANQDIQPDDTQVVDNDDPKNNNTTDSKNKNGNNPPVKVENAAKVYPSFAKIQKIALSRMVPASQEVTANRSKPYCRWQTAEAYLEVGDLSEGAAQIKQLGRVKPSIPFYQVIPLTQLAWKELKSQKDATATINQAYALAGKIPHIGETAFEAKVQLAALLVAVGRQADALNVIEQESENQSTGRFVTHLLQTRTIGEGNFDAVINQSSVQNLRQSQWSAVALLLSTHNKFHEAVTWSQQHHDAIVQVESLALCFEAKAYFSIKQNRPNLVELFQPTISKFAPETKAYLMARVALQQFHLGHQAESKETLVRVKRSLSQLTMPSPLIRPELKTIYEGGFSEKASLQIAALAFAEAAHLEASLSNSEESWKLLQQALRMTRGMTPSPKVCRTLVAELKQLGTAYFRSELKGELKLKNSDQTRSAFIEYRDHCRELNDLAMNRFQLQVDILSHAATWKGLPLFVWNEVKDRTATENNDMQEPYDETVLGTLLLSQLQGDTNKTNRDEISSLLKKNETKKDDVIEFQQHVSNLIQQEKLTEAAYQIENNTLVDKYQRKQWALQFVCQLKTNAGLAIQLIRSYKNPLLRELSLQTLASLVVRHSQGQEFWTKYNNLFDPSTERIAFCRGVIAGVVARKISE